jgi:Ca2+:H+ antiporter
MKQFLKDLRANPIFWLGIFIPVVLVMHWSHVGSNSLMFLFSLLAIIPLGGFISHATEGVAAKTWNLGIPLLAIYAIFGLTLFFL